MLDGFGMRVTRLLIVASIVGAAFLFGCESLTKGGKRRGARSRRSEYTPQQERFIRQLRRTAAGTPERQRLLTEARWPHLGPYPTQLREAAVVATIRRGEAMFMGSQVIASHVRITPPIARAFREARIEAPVVPADDLKPQDLRKAARLRIDAIDYFVGGRCATVRTSVERGPSWFYAQRMLFALSGRDWRLVSVMKP